MLGCVCLGSGSPRNLSLSPYLCGSTDGKSSSMVSGPEGWGRVESGGDGDPDHYHPDSVYQVEPPSSPGVSGFRIKSGLVSRCLTLTVQF